MKFNISSFTAAAIVASLAISSLAAPLPETEYDLEERDSFDDIVADIQTRALLFELEERGYFDDELELTVRAPPNIHPDAHKFAKWVSKNPGAVNDKPMMYYSGGSTVNGAYSPAWRQVDQHCKTTGCQQINDVIAKSPVRKASWKDNKDWAATSKAVAQASSGPVHVLTGSSVSKQSVWSKTEKPTLDKNKKVTSIQQHHYNNDGKITKGKDIKKKK